ncbi:MULTISPECIES: methylated-DNA--[protein]-cysteine S-methyltransferase [Amycolatopsis]|uniref:Methylated-DNA-[protein]-cysteine S-methyltransferase n=2 Tax=Amycolatopsis TaxID=1813 RepID=A0A2A9F7R0_9PSEU|nr:MULTISPECIES: methylated-DNA--[protein]-cysteine S-methyltransferase [Amycolatopsis]PFG47208.1 methylated-DNA-[protein]-cysteine S-methyltransferase [Amycolatopsis sulphurea]RJQ79516.1 methylated-DNA--[protein]-cysteine S-methyltransferase [Amycolatopsis panacis]
MTVEFTVFDTPIGACGLAWRDGAVVGTALPGSSAARTRAHLVARFPDAAEAPVPDVLRETVDGIVALLSGARTDLRAVPLDFRDVPDFHRRAYDVARGIPPGKTCTYGDIAHELGMPGSAQAVGQAMGHNPFPIVVPCHRVLAAGNKPGGFSAPGGVETKRRMLVIEGALPEEPTLF